MTQVRGLPLLSGYFDPRRRQGRSGGLTLAERSALMAPCATCQTAAVERYNPSNGAAYVGCPSCRDFLTFPSGTHQPSASEVVWASTIAASQRAMHKHAPAASQPSQSQPIVAPSMASSQRIALGQPCPVPGCYGHGVQRIVQATGKAFIGCSEYPSTGCKGRIVVGTPSITARQPSAPSSQPSQPVAAPAPAPAPAPAAPAPSQPVAGASVTLNAQAFATVAKSLEGEASTRLGLEVHERTLQLWLGTVAALAKVAPKLAGEEQVAAAYALAVTEREYDAARQHALEVYRQSGFTADPVKALARLSVEQVVRAAYEAGFPLYISGAPGVGKTFNAMRVLRDLTGHAPVRQQGGTATRESFVGQRELVEQNGASVTRFSSSPLLNCWTGGVPYVLDEADKTRPDHMDALTELLESWAPTWNVEGVTYQRAPGFAFVATGNTLGAGEAAGADYEGTRVLNKAIRSRMLYYVMPSPSWAEREARLKAFAGALGVSFAGGK